MSKVPISLIIDDAGPVNMKFFHDFSNPHELLVPPAFLRKFAEVSKRCGIKGKFSVVPMPAGLGRLDGKVNMVPARNITQYMKIIKKDIEPMYSITPEILTHFRAYNLENGTFLHALEDVHFSTLSAKQISDYVSLSLEILVNCGLTPTGVTSPWSCGIDNELNYAKGIGMAFRKVMKTDRCFYFLHCMDDVRKPTVMADSKETGTVVSIPANTFDPFGNTLNPKSVRDAVHHAHTHTDIILSEDGRHGLVRDLYEQQLPITLITHWQSIYSDGREIGLEWLETLAKRINKVFGNQIEWMNFMDLAQSVRSTRNKKQTKKR